MLFALVEILVKPSKVKNAYNMCMPTLARTPSNLAGSWRIPTSFLELHHLLFPLDSKVTMIEVTFHPSIHHVDMFCPPTGLSVCCWQLSPTSRSKPPQWHQIKMTAKMTQF